jgi:hypothetical protein
VARRDAEQADLAAALSAALRHDGYIVRQTDVESGYAICGVVRPRPVWRGR